MTNRKIYALSAVLALGTTLGSCSKDNDVNDGNDSQNVITNPVANDAEAVALANGAYSYWQPCSSSFSFVIELNSDQLISFEGEEDQPGPVNSRFEQQKDTWYQKKIFGKLFLAIESNNDAISKISASSTVSEATKNATIGKSRLLRGLAYLYLVQLYGEVPVITDENPNNLTRNSIDEVYTQITNDLKAAAELLPEYDASPINPSKGVAYALLSRAYLAWGNKPLTYEQVQAIADAQKDPTHEVDEAKLKLAVEYANKVIEGGHYALKEKFAENWGRAFESQGPEHIFTIRHDGDASDAQGNHQTHCSWTFPFQLNTDNHTEVADYDLYTVWKAAEPTDKRLDFTYKTHIFNPEDNKTYDYVPPFYTPANGKGVDETWENSVNLEITLNDIDRIEIRYAEVLLNKAEALVELGKNADAAEPFNLLRKRAGVSEKTSVTLDDIKKEWGYEFTYEQKTLLNHYRWKDLIASTRNVSTFEHFKDDYKQTGVDYPGFEGVKVSAFWSKIYKHLHAKYDNVRGRHYRQPIPEGLQGEDLGITPQNPGYNE